MKLKKLLKDIPVHHVKGSKDVDVTGICINSKVIAPGNLFIAKKGRSDDGSLYIPEALAGGAAAILTDIFDPTLKGVVQIIHPCAAEIEGKIAAEFYQHPSEELFTVAITGTNGKTTTSFMIKHLLDMQGACGLIGTIEYIIGSHRYQASRTTPDASSNQKMLREMVLQGCQSAVMEVTSHALDQGRVDQIDFDVAIFTNLTLDHLDYHHTMEEYCAAKRKLFQGLQPHKKKKMGTPKTAVVNADSLWATTMLEQCTAQVLTYGIDHVCDIRASHITLTPGATKFSLCYQGQTYACSCPLIGRHNVYNYLATVAVGLVRHIPLPKIIERLAHMPCVPGRLEPVPNSLSLPIFVDFAHTEDALINVLTCLRELGPARLITVFGCGGDRDRSKRPKMAAATEEYGDFSILTSDNPRSEDPLAICLEVAKGFKDPARYVIEVDRRTAIEKAIQMATPRDIILIAGKGHEPYQIFAHKTIEFDDRKVAAQVCEKRELECHR